MEQQNQVQSVTDTEVLQNSIAQSQNTVDPVALQWNEEAVDYVFKDGVYTCKDLEGSFMSITSLREAWRKHVSEVKVAQAQKDLLRARNSRTQLTPKQRSAAASKAMKEKEKWSTP